MKNLKKLRTKYHLSQQQLAEKFNLTQQSIYKYENNLSEPDIQTLMLFADYFNTSVDYLIGFTASPDIETISRELVLSNDTVTFLKKFLSLPEPQRQVILDMVNILADDTTKKTHPARDS